MNSGEENERNLLKAMRDTAEKSRQVLKVQKVFTAQTWFWRAVSVIPSLENMGMLGDTAVSILESWLGRKHEDCKWYAIGPLMQEIALDDFLNRKGNIL